MSGEGPAPGLLECFPDAVAAANALRAHGWRVAVAESCTGGLLGAALTAVPGSSAYVIGGVIAYSNAVKTDLLAVPPDLLARCGAVSEEVATAMARGVRGRLGGDVGVAITGVAGPGADEGGKPAGLVFVAVVTATADRLLRLDDDGGREANRVASVRAALRLLVELG